MATRTRRRLNTLAALLQPVAVLLAIGAVASLLVLVAWGRHAYAFRDAPTVTVTLSPGATCTTYSWSGGGSRTECPASWTVDGRGVSGTLTNEFGGMIPSEAGEVQARVWGTTAATEPFQPSEYRWGLRSPFGLLAVPVALLLFWLSALARRRAAAQSLDENNPARSMLGTTRHRTDGKTLPPAIGAAVAEARIGEPVAVFRDKPIIVIPTVSVMLVIAAIVMFDYTPLRVFLVIVLLWLLIILLGQVFGRSGGRVSVLTQNGFYLRDETGATRAGRYDQLLAITRQTVRVEGRGTESRVLLEPADGDAFELGRRWAGTSRLEEQMVRDANAAVLPTLLERLDRGEIATFGVLGASSTGLHVGPKVIPWSTIEDLTVEGDEVVLRLGAERVTLPSGEVSFLPALIWLAQRQRGVAPGP